MSDFGLNDNKVTGGDSSKGQQILIGRVTKVILGEYTKEGKIDPDFAVQGGWGSLGSIKFNLFLDTNNPHQEVKSNNFARPLFGNIKQYPLKGEIVAIIQGPSTRLNEKGSSKEFYYISSYNLWNSSHHNAFPDLIQYASKVVSAITDQDITSGASKAEGNVDTKYPLGNYFQEKAHIKPLLPFEGDVIIEGRFGQSIRFGSTVTEQKNQNPWSKAGNTGDPITIITNRKADNPKSPESWIPTVENINKDGSSIWLSSGQAINMDISKYPLDTFRLGFQATYGPDTILPLQDLSPGIQTIATAEYDKRVLDNV